MGKCSKRQISENHTVSFSMIETQLPETVLTKDVIFFVSAVEAGKIYPCALQSMLFIHFSLYQPPADRAVVSPSNALLNRSI